MPTRAVPLRPHTPSSLPSEKNQLKLEGLAFGQAFQTLFKMSMMYSVDHPAAARSMQQSLDLLLPFLKEGQPFTIGFMNDRLLLNRTLVTQTNLTHLQVELAKREIAAVTFQPGVTLKEFKRAMAQLTLRPAVIAERGGIRKYLAGNPIEGIRIIPAAQPRGDDDTLDAGTDIESYLAGQSPHRLESGRRTTGLETLLAAARAKDPNGFGGNAREVLNLADEATRNVLADPDCSLTDLLEAITHLLTGLQLDQLISALSPDQQSDLRGQPPGVVAARLMEDSLAGWSVDRLAAAPPGEGSVMVEREVLATLLRGLKATRIAERLLRKLGQLVQRANLPREEFERIRREVVWSSLPPREKQAQLMALKVYTDQDFARLLRRVEEAMTARKMGEVTELAQHYFAVLELIPNGARAQELKRAPQLLSLLKGIETLGLMHTLAEPLTREILSATRLHWPCHRESANCLAWVAQNAGHFEDFEFVRKVAVDLKCAMALHPGQHGDCCGRVLTELLAPEALDRLIESHLQRRGEPRWAKTVTSLLAMLGAPGAEAIFRRLDEEPSASKRLPLLRLARSLGPSAVEATRKRLVDPRWFVVRNAAYVLGDIGDPDLPEHLRETLRHPDLRVQQAAITALLKSSAGGRGEVLASALPKLHAGVLEMALDELTVLKDPWSVEHLHALILMKKKFKAGVLEKAVVALAAISSDRAAHALYKIIGDTEQPASVRKAAVSGLSNHPSGAALEWVSKQNDPAPGDVLSVSDSSASVPTGVPDHPAIAAQVSHPHPRLSINCSAGVPTRVFEVINSAESR